MRYATPLEPQDREAAGSTTGTAGNSGFTFIETFVALFVLTISMAGAMALMTWMMRANAYSNRTTTAVTLAQDKVDELLDQRYSQIASGNDTANMYRRNWQVVEDAAGKTITVTVGWSNQDNRNHQVAVAMMVDRKEMGGF
jgi:Tfp pilus assembly protein PilV